VVLASGLWLGAAPATAPVIEALSMTAVDALPYISDATLYTVKTLRNTYRFLNDASIIAEIRLQSQAYKVSLWAEDVASAYGFNNYLSKRYIPGLEEWIYTWRYITIPELFEKTHKTVEEINNLKE
jgi:hypothetical protein